MGRTVLGVASRAGGQRLTVYVASVTISEAGSIEVDAREAWKGSKAQDTGRELTDLHDAFSNLLEGTSDKPEAIAVKRVECPQRGRPASSYDDRIRFEGPAMLAAVGQNCRYFAYRKNELARAHQLIAEAKRCDGWPGDDEPTEAAEAACAALSDLLAEAD